MSCLIRPRKTLVEPFHKLTLRGVFGRRIFSIELARDTGVTTADLAREIECSVGVPVATQRLLFNGHILDPPDVGVWAPQLSNIGLREGDRVHVMANVADTQPDFGSCQQLKDVLKRMSANDAALTLLIANTDKFFRGYQGECCIPKMTKLREHFECMKSRYRADIEVMMTLEFDHRNYMSQAQCRRTIDHAQRQVDKCTDIAEGIFQRIAIRHCPPRCVRLPPISPWARMA